MYTDESAAMIFPANLEPAAVIQAFDAACNAGDVDRVMNFFSPDAVVRFMYPPPFPEPDTYSGQAEIRTMLARYLADQFHIQSSDYKVAGDQMTWCYQLTTGRLQGFGVDQVDGAAGATFAHGKILHLTLSFTPRSTERIVTALDQAGIKGPISEALEDGQGSPAGPQDDAMARPRPHLGPTWEPVGPRWTGK